MGMTSLVSNACVPCRIVEIKQWDRTLWTVNPMEQSGAACIGIVNLGALALVLAVLGGSVLIVGMGETVIGWMALTAFDGDEDAGTKTKGEDDR